MPLYREDLENVHCFVPGCRDNQHDGPVYVRSTCHIDSPACAYDQVTALRLSSA